MRVMVIALVVLLYLIAGAIVASLAMRSWFSNDAFKDDMDYTMSTILMLFWPFVGAILLLGVLVRGVDRAIASVVAPKKKGEDSE